MFQNTLSCILIFIVPVLLAWPLGAYMSKVYQNRNSVLNFLKPLENFIFKICRINAASEMNWKQYLIAIAVINSVWFVYGFMLLIFQGNLFLNPAHNPSMEWSLAVNSSISFLTSTNLQHYSGESGATYLSQTGVFMFLQFVSAATSLCAGVAVVRGLLAKNRTGLGNFYSDFVRSLTRILLPLCIITAIFFAFSGVPATFEGPQHVITLQKDSSTVATGPVAPFLPIKELGSNGGGFFGANDAHPFENPNFFTFILHSVIVFLLPMAFVFFIGYYLDERKFGKMIFAIMTAGFLLITIPIIIQEVKGNPRISAMGINNSGGNMEGKEIRYGSFYSAFYSGINSAVPAGTVTGVHDSYMPLSAVYMLVGMQIDAFFGGLGTGWINMFIYLIVAVFLATMMIGRTPEIFGKKIGIEEVQMAVGVSVLQMMVPAVLTAIACYVYTHYSGGNAALNWLTNKGNHGFTTMLYEYISSSAGNGSEFSGLGNNTPFWNLTTSVAILCGRFIPIAGAIIIAGFLQKKKYVPVSGGSLKINSTTFGVFLFMVIIILNALSFLSAFIIGPIAEQVK